VSPVERRLSGEAVLKASGVEAKTGARYAGGAAATAGAVTGAAIAAPVVVAGVQAIGFGTAGITAGSWAAAIMSAEAIASGGGVLAGGLCATGQSIGATGTLAALGTVGSIAVPVVGAVVGAVVLGVTAYFMYKAYDDAKEKEKRVTQALTTLGIIDQLPESANELKALLHKELLRAHPDRNMNTETSNTETASIFAAREVLTEILERTRVWKMQEGYLHTIRAATSVFQWRAGQQQDQVSYSHGDLLELTHNDE
jgi:hypothetical protein